MKKRTCILVSVLILILSIALCTTVLAINSTAVSISSAEGKEGDTVQLSVSIADNAGFGGITVKVGFDKNVLEFKGAECLLAEGLFETSPADKANAEGSVVLAYVGYENVSVNSAIFNVTFSIKEGAADGDSAVTLELDESSFVYNGSDMKDFTAQVSGGKVTVLKGLLGDVDLDGDISAKDLTLIARHIARIELITNSTALANADINKDGDVTSADLTKLARHIAKIEPIV